jgi:pilus assembly protein Flp/PilA
MKQVVAAARRLRDLATVKYLGVKNFLARREEGASLVEYALLVALIALACIAAITFLGNGISNAFNTIANKLSNAVG